MISIKFLCFLTWLAFGACTDVRVIGGTPIRIEQAPFMGLLRPVGMAFHCGASIINEWFLVSAGHCLTSSRMEVTVGTDNAMYGGEKYEVEKLVRHPEYTDRIYPNDIMVVKLKRKLNFNSRVRPITLAEPGIQIPSGAEFQVIGFGKTESAQSSNQLLQARIPHVQSQQCRSLFKQVNDRMICAGGSGKGGCNGDSGGPLVYNNKLVGVVSFGNLQCSSFGVFTRVSAFHDFINSVISQN